MQIPLAERMRPRSLDDYIGQEHLVGTGAVLRNMITSGSIASMIFWGPPGTGKTTLANIIANQLNRPFYRLSAINSGVKDVRDVIDKAKQSGGLFTTRNPILFIDEIHRFSKSQQDSLLQAVEKGWVTLIGATTENPSFEVIPALLSRCQVYILNSFDKNSNKIDRKIINIQSELGLITKGGYKHFMEKEIYEQPEAAKTTFERRHQNGIIDFSDIDNDLDFIKNVILFTYSKQNQMP